MFLHVEIDELGGNGAYFPATPAARSKTLSGTEKPCNGPVAIMASSPAAVAASTGRSTRSAMANTSLAPEGLASSGRKRR